MTIPGFRKTLARQKIDKSVALRLTLNLHPRDEVAASRLRRCLRSAMVCWMAIAPAMATRSIVLLSVIVAPSALSQSKPPRCSSSISKRRGRGDRCRRYKLQIRRGVPTTLGNSRSAPVDDRLRKLQVITACRPLRTMLALLRARCRGTSRVSELTSLISNY